MIRDAKPEDVPALIEMGQAFFDEAGLPERFAALGMPEITFCPESFVRSCEGLAILGVMLVAEDNGEIVGMLGATFAPAPWNFAVKLAQEAWWYVKPAHRKGVGVALLRELERRAATHGVALCAMTAEHGLRGEAVGRLYQAKAYCPAETTFWKRLQAVQ